MGSTPTARTINAGNKVTRRRSEQRDVPLQEALHHHLSRVGAHARGGKAGREQRQREEQCGGRTEHLTETRVRALDGVDRLIAQHLSGDDQHGEVDQAGDDHRHHHVHPRAAQQHATLALGVADAPALDQRAVQVDHVRHHGRADDPRGEQDAVGAVERRDHAAGEVPGVGRAHEQAVGEAEQDEREETGDGASRRPGARGRRARRASATTAVMSRRRAAETRTAAAAPAPPRVPRRGRWRWRRSRPAPTARG